MEEKESFFHFFDSVKLPSSDDEGEDEEQDEQEEELLREKIDNDVELAFALRDQVIPNAILWFTGEAANDDDDDEGDYEGEDGDDDEDDEDDE